MGVFDASRIVNLVGQLGGDHQQASQLLGSVLGGQGGQVDTQQHGELLQQLGINPQQLHDGGYQEHLDRQNHPDFQSYQQNEGDYQQNEGDYQQNEGDYQQNEGDYQQNEGDYQQDQGDYQQDQGDYQQSEGGDGQGGGGYEQDQRF